jgi:MYXO-CTERM domain-containing protein
MFQSIDQCETHKRELSATDVNAVSSLYAENQAPEETAAVAARACTFGGVPAPGGSGWVLGLLVGAGFLARRRSRQC